MSWVKWGQGRNRNVNQRDAQVDVSTHRQHRTVTIHWHPHNSKAFRQPAIYCLPIVLGFELCRDFSLWRQKKRLRWILPIKENKWQFFPHNSKHFAGRFYSNCARCWIEQGFYSILKTKYFEVSFGIVQDFKLGVTVQGTWTSSKTCTFRTFFFGSRTIPGKLQNVSVSTVQ